VPVPPQFTYLFMASVAGIIFHVILWARNAPFLWSRRRVILKVMLLAVVWQFLFDPIGGLMGAWYFDVHKTLGLWLFNVMPIEDLIGVAITSSAAACAVLVFGYSPRRWI
jgi:lycopene cyclase domain-containing protein